MSLPQLTTDRLIEIVLAHADRPIEQDMTDWKNEYTLALKAHEQALKKQAADNPTRYGICTFTSSSVQAGGGYFPARVPSDIMSVDAPDLPQWAKQHGVSIDELMRVLRGEQEQVAGFYAWENSHWSASRRYIDRTAEREERAMFLKEDRELAERIAARNIQAAKAVKPQPMFPKVAQFYPKKG